MDVDEFVSWWGSRDRRDLDAVVAALDATTDTAGGEVGRLCGCMEVATTLRRNGRRQEACRAAHLTIEAAMRACETTGLRDDDRDAATRLARAAGEAARALVADVDSASAAALLRPFFGTGLRATIPTS